MARRSIAPVPELTEGMLMGVGNPLLDISAVVDEGMLQKYDLQADDAIMAEEKHIPLYKELIEKYHAEFIAGGSVQNSMRVAQWVLGKPKVTTYFGCVGNDDYAKILKERAASDGVKAVYQVCDNTPTGTCAVLITGTNRSLCANLAAAQKFTPDFLKKTECLEALEQAKIIYTSGFFLAVSMESILYLAEYCNANNLIFAMNMSACFVPQFYIDQLEKIVPYVDVLMGNELEAASFAKSFKIKTTNIEEIAIAMSKVPKQNTARPRVIVVTQGAERVVLVDKGKVDIIPVIELSRQQIVDTNGAGDAFAGGFLSQMILKKPYLDCVNCGIRTATHIIQHSGCTFSGEPECRSS